MFLKNRIIIYTDLSILLFFLRNTLGNPYMCSGIDLIPHFNAFIHYIQKSSESEHLKNIYRLHDFFTYDLSVHVRPIFQLVIFNLYLHI